MRRFLAGVVLGGGLAFLAFLGAFGGAFFRIFNRSDDDQETPNG